MQGRLSRDWLIWPARICEVFKNYTWGDIVCQANFAKHYVEIKRSFHEFGRIFCNCTEKRKMLWKNRFWIGVWGEKSLRAGDGWVRNWWGVIYREPPMRGGKKFREGRWDQEVEEATGVVFLNSRPLFFKEILPVGIRSEYLCFFDPWPIAWWKPQEHRILAAWAWSQISPFHDIPYIFQVVLVPASRSPHER